MRTQVLLASLVLLATAATAYSQTFNLTIQFAEQELEPGQDPEAALKDVLEGKKRPAGTVEMLAFRELPEESEFDKEYSSPVRVDLGGQEALAVRQVKVSGSIEPFSDHQAIVELSLNIGGEEPFLVRQRRFSEEGDSELFTQRSRTVGFSLEQTVVLKVGERSVVHVNIEGSEGKVVCRSVRVSLESGSIEEG